MGRSVLMTAARAREAIGEAVSSRVTELFQACLTEMREDGIVEVYAKSWRGSTLPGEVPPTCGRLPEMA
ncbi:hypothetical protein [Kitasatospora sp. NPDC058190]|uniref:hypothetical protein n=1 Tax=Kitasatospora sp. NPDC058190 TaxID=3346371 RepID=UPI0036D9B5E5